jgi:hypothetical protein
MERIGGVFRSVDFKDADGASLHFKKVMPGVISPELEKRVIYRRPLRRNKKYLARQDLTLYSLHKNSRE